MIVLSPTNQPARMFFIVELQVGNVIMCSIQLLSLSATVISDNLFHLTPLYFCSIKNTFASASSKFLIDGSSSESDRGGYKEYRDTGGYRGGYFISLFLFLCTE